MLTDSRLLLTFFVTIFSSYAKIHNLTSIYNVSSDLCHRVIHFIFFNQQLKIGLGDPGIYISLGN